jgi:hypothetical protein
MADSNFDILIRLQAELDGATESVSALKELKRQAIATGVSTGDLDKQIAAAQRQAEGFGKRLEDAGKKGHGRIEGLRRAMGLLASQFGSLGQLAMGAFSLPALGVTALAVGIGTVVGHFKTLNDKIEEMAGKLRGLDLASLDDMRTRTQGIAQDMANYLRDMDASRKENDPFQGKSFTGPEDELSQRRSEAARLENAANAAAEAAALNRYDPNALSTQDRVKDAQSKREALRKAIDDAASPTTSDAILGTFNMMSPKTIELALARRTAAAQSAFDANEQVISGGGATLGRWANRQGDLDQAAGISKGLFTSNNARILALQGGVASSDEERRRGIRGQLSEGGFGPARSVLMPGAGAAAKAWSEGHAATAQDSQDFEQIIRFIKVSEREAFRKLLVAIFKDGIVTPEELAKLKAELQNKSQRP